MARRHRTRTRTRRGSETARTAPATVREEREESRPRAAVHRPQRSSRTGWARAVGDPSASLERAAVMERGFVGKDFRRVALVVAISVVVLVVAGLLESAFVK